MDTAHRRDSCAHSERRGGYAWAGCAGARAAGARGGATAGAFSAVAAPGSSRAAAIPLASDPADANTTVVPPATTGHVPPYGLPERGGLPVKLLTLLFLAILTALHLCGDGEAGPMPLSMARDGPVAVLGYLAFVPLVGIGPLMVTVSWKAGEDGAAWFYALATVVMGYIAVTPSEGTGHVFWSLVLPLLFYAYYARVLIEADSFGVFAHLAVPFVLVCVTLNYGLWQKCLIIYFLIVANIHYQVLVARCGGTGPWVGALRGPAR